ncbi:PREDICTED: protein YIF1B [Ceratosolen solmsi marchali]|uniref:Protein YIF1 n=1 Tax=Ceratosolen solmsi marchali TaxID=326594 RepID=A0AAJ6YSX7_9HYME|nr:PREDICTED: protein YIF1B [Ceratosolen solmsi marchali]
MQSNPYMYNQQVPMHNGIPLDYGFNVPEQNMPPATPTSYGFNHQVPMSMQNDGFQPNQFGSRLLTDPLVTNVAMQYGNALASTGKQQFEKFVPITALRYYFAVDTDYVVMKLFLLFFPFTHKDWSIKYEQEHPLQPRFERNAPDMYIPTMAFLTYVVMSGLALGTQEKFTPEQLGITASSALAWGIIELLVHIITLYVMNLDTSLRLGYYSVFSYFSISLAFFLIRSLKLRVIPEGHSSYSALGNKRRLYFILFIAGIQPICMWWLSYHLI